MSRRPPRHALDVTDPPVYSRQPVNKCAVCSPAGRTDLGTLGTLDAEQRNTAATVRLSGDSFAVDTQRFADLLRSGSNDDTGALAALVGSALVVERRGTYHEGTFLGRAATVDRAGKRGRDRDDRRHDGPDSERAAEADAEAAEWSIELCGVPCADHPRGSQPERIATAPLAAALARAQSAAPLFETRGKMIGVLLARHPRVQVHGNCV